MIKKLLMTAALAAAALTFLPADQADAQRGARRGGGGVAARAVGPRPAFRPRVVVRGPIVVRRPVRVIRRPVIVAPIGIVAGCEWMRRRAVTTGSPYWWRRYRVCRGY